MTVIAGQRGWRVATGERLAPLPRLPLDLFSPDGRILFIESKAQILPWSMTRWEEAGPPYRVNHRSLFANTPGNAYSIQFTPDSRLLALGTEDSVQVWDLTKAEPAGPPLRSEEDDPDVVFSPDGRILAAALLATWVTDRAGLERFAGAASPVTDDRPLIEHAAWVRRGEIGRVLPRLLSYATDVPLDPADPLRPAVEAERAELLGFYRFSLHALTGERNEAAAALRDVLAHDPTNPYYLWVAYGRTF